MPVETKEYGDLKVIRHFAYFPTVVEGGKRIWLRHFYQTYEWIKEGKSCEGFSAMATTTYDAWLTIGEPTLYHPETCSSDLMTWIHERMASARQYGLELEVITWAFYAMKSDPTISIEEAIAAGCEEWDV